MVVDITLRREPSQPFGFRLIGGSDFEIPLTVSRVVEGGIAHRAGMLEGDVVVRINDNPTINMSHESAHDELVAAGDEFTVSVLRATNLLADGSAVDATEQQDTTVADADTKQEQERIDKIIPDKPVTDEEIAELLSGEAELLKEHGVLGVNFNRMMPKSGVFKRSEVFQVLNDQHLQAKEIEESQRWTTFLQKPERPPPEPRNANIFKNTYRPVIVKQPKPKCAPDYRTTPPPEPVQVQVQASNEFVNNEIVEERHEEEVQEIVQVQEQQFTTEMSSETIITSTEMTSTTTTELVTFEELAADATGDAVNEELVAEEIKSQSDEVSIVSSAFAEQLENVQSQLMALSHLPKTIQSTLDEITKQLQSLIPTSKLYKQKSVEPENNSTAEENTKANEETVDTTAVTDQVVVESTISAVENTTTVTETVEVEIVNQQQQQIEQMNQEEMEHHPTKDEIDEYEESQRKFRELWEKKREKQEPVDAKTELTAELKQKVTEERVIKQKRARNFRGLQPQERPIILPGGRKWKNEKDAMNDELIAEIISSQAELIMGTTLGSHHYESPILTFDDRVNFLKYQKPEKDLSFLKNSETYRQIHHMVQHENGIEKRPAMVAAEEDVLKCASPNPLNQNSS
ncbi:unnamed protein product [Chironomus riparius]|uniref:PDZ domain-containing protein n=1 Tax=Chironomus riparius TaxID=315576 RepID=A0A9N9WR16_9DIPT|nr:unnamed protein product [Chironomus riparius]